MAVNRRTFLKLAGVTSLTLTVPQIRVWANDVSTSRSNNKLIVIFLRGGVDGLSITVPYGDSHYFSARSKTAIPKSSNESAVFSLDRDFGLHPCLAPLMPLWHNKSLAFVLNTGSPHPTRSHFEAQDYMESGIPGNKSTTAGWLNRLLQQLPNNQSPIRAVNIGATTPRILQGPIDIASYAPSARRRINPIEIPAIRSAFGVLYEGRTDTLGSAFTKGFEARDTINDKLQGEMLEANQGAIPANKFNGFGKQLGRLIANDPRVQVAFVGLGGFDTHVNQGGSKGQLANQLTTLGNGLADLVDSLGATYEKTMIVVMSEFGRTVKENGNGGTDHGHGNTMWILGGKINGGRLYGRWDGINQRSLYEGRDLPVTTDFRAVLSTIIAEHMQLSKAQLNCVFPGFSQLDKSLAPLVRV